MKTKKYMMVVLVALFVLSPFLNFDSWAFSRSYPIMMQPIVVMESCPVIVPVCFQLGNDTCCETYCCTSTDYSNCVLRGGAPVCMPNPKQPAK
jgi:hypothetical protein